MVKKMPTIQIDDGRWYEIAWMGQHEECCRCGVKHVVDYKVERGKLMMRARYVEEAKK